MCVAYVRASNGEKWVGMRVLLIEDDSATAQFIERMLKSDSFNVYTTDLGEEGVDLGKLYDYDIILLDLNLPDMSGFEVLRTLRVSKVKTPILILTGLGDIEGKDAVGVDRVRVAVEHDEIERGMVLHSVEDGAEPGLRIGARRGLLHVHIDQHENDFEAFAMNQIEEWDDVGQLGCARLWPLQAEGGIDVAIGKHGRAGPI